jgi:hypothetical protein
MSHYYNGTKEPGIANAITIAKALNMGVDDLVTYVDKTKASGYDPTLNDLKDKFNYLIDFVPEHMRQPILDIVQCSAIPPEPPQ